MIHFGETRQGLQETQVSFLAFFAVQFFIRGNNV